MRGKYVAGESSVAVNHKRANHVSAVQPHSIVADHQQSLSVPRFPWHY